LIQIEAASTITQMAKTYEKQTPALFLNLARKSLIVLELGIGDPLEAVKT